MKWGSDMEQNMGYGFHQMPEQVDEILGEDFWWDIQKTLPKRGPSIDIYQDLSSYVIIVELPGLSETRSISVRQVGHKIRLSGEIPYAYPAQQDQLIRNERFIGSFTRELSIPFPFKSEQIEAILKNGLLQIIIQKGEEIETTVDIPIQQ